MLIIITIIKLRQQQNWKYSLHQHWSDCLPFQRQITWKSLEKRKREREKKIRERNGRGRHELSSPEFILESAPTRDKAQPRIEVNVEPRNGQEEYIRAEERVEGIKEEERGMKLAAGSRESQQQQRQLECAGRNRPGSRSKGIRAAGSPLCATCAVYPPPCVSGIALTFLSFLIISTYPFPRPVLLLHHVHAARADRTIPSTATATSRIIVRFRIPLERLEIAALSSPWRGVSRRRAQPRCGHDRYPKSRLMSPSKCAKRSRQKSAELLGRQHARTRIQRADRLHLSSSVA